MNLFALTIFLGAFLLFQIQPLMAKFILPWFGGGPGELMRRSSLHPGLDLGALLQVAANELDGFYESV